MIISRFELIKILADGAFHSGEDLARHFGVTRASVSKAMGRLELYGLDVHSVRGKGYRLSDRLVLLNKEKILALLPDPAKSSIEQLDIFDSIDSTNTHLLNQVRSELRLPKAQCRICLSEMQTAGRGRRGRNWVSPFGHNIYLSMLREFPSGAKSLDGLSLVVSLILLKTLQRYGIQDLGLKWPNDLVVNRRKLAGVLLELSGDTLGACHVVIGAGLNVKLLTADMRDVTQPWITLLELGFQLERRNQLVASLIEDLVAGVDKFQKFGFPAFLDEWSAYDVTKGQQVEIVTSIDRLIGVGQGVDGSGGLLLSTNAGIQKFNTGEVSLRVGVA
jgi:BirA family biotin operon repressor/biotin-[acetyl-CoA-carboxylase] ligase